MMLMGALKIAEKGFVGGATLAALLPLWQWYDETDERRVERLSSFIGAGDTCMKWLRSDLVEALASETWDATHYIGDDGEPALTPLPVQIRANMTIFCAEMLDYLQNDFGSFEKEPSAYDYYVYLYEASYWIDPADFDDYLTRVHNEPELTGTHSGEYQFGNRDQEYYEWEINDEDVEAYYTEKGFQ